MILSSSSVFSIVLLHFVLSVSAFSFLHPGPENGEKAFLNGRHGSVQFSVEIKRDVLLWDELSAHKTKITRCSTLQRDSVELDLSGSALKISDFKLGVSFVISKDHFESACRKLQQDHDRSDPTHFFLIKEAKFRSTGSNPVFSLVLKSVHGSQVAPSGRFTQLKNRQKYKKMANIEFYETKTAMKPSMKRQPAKYYRRTVRQNIADEIIIPNPDVENNVFVVPGVSVNTTARLDASVGDLKFERISSLTIVWEQTLFIDYASRLSAEAQYKGEDRKRIYRRRIRDFSYSRRILFLGSININAYVTLDLVLSVAIDQQIDAIVSASHENVMQVSARLSSPALSIDSLIPPGFENSGNAIIDYESAVLDEFGITGFYGYEPGIEIIGNVLNDNYLVQTTIALGLQANFRRKFPPFQPLPPGSKRTFGSCDTCHMVRASGEIVGRDLKTKIFEDNKLEDEKIHDSSIFSIPLATACLLEAGCQ